MLILYRDTLYYNIYILFIYIYLFLSLYIYIYYIYVYIIYACVLLVPSS